MRTGLKISVTKALIVHRPLFFLSNSMYLRDTSGVEAAMPRSMAAGAHVKTPTSIFSFWKGIFLDLSTVPIGSLARDSRAFKRLF